MKDIFNNIVWPFRREQDKDSVNQLAAIYYSHYRESFNLFKNVCLLKLSTHPNKTKFFVSLCSYIEYDIRLTQWESIEHIGRVARRYEDHEIDSVLYIIFNEVVQRYFKIDNPHSKFKDYLETNMFYGFRNWIRRHYHAFSNVFELPFDDNHLYDYTYQLFSDNQEIKLLLDHYLYCLEESGGTPMLLQIFSEALMGNSLIQTMKYNYGIGNPINSALYKNTRKHREEVLSNMVSEYRHDIYTPKQLNFK